MKYFIVFRLSTVSVVIDHADWLGCHAPLKTLGHLCMFLSRFIGLLYMFEILTLCG